MSTDTPSLLSAKDQRELITFAKITKLQNIGRRAQAKADWLATMLGVQGGDKNDVAYGFYPRSLRERPDDLDLRRDYQDAIRVREANLLKAAQAVEEIQSLRAAR